MFNELGADYTANIKYQQEQRQQEEDDTTVSNKQQEAETVVNNSSGFLQAFSQLPLVILCKFKNCYADSHKEELIHGIKTLLRKNKQFYELIPTIAKFAVIKNLSCKIVRVNKINGGLVKLFKDATCDDTGDNGPASSANIAEVQS